MTDCSRRRLLLGATALPGALALAGCSGGLPPLPGSRSPGNCLDPSEEIPEEAYETVPEGVIVDPVPLDESLLFMSSTLTISPDGSMLAACEMGFPQDPEHAGTRGVVLWDAGTGAVIHRFRPPMLGRLAWHPDGDRLAIGDGRLISIVDLEGTLERTLFGHELPRGDTAAILDLAFSPDGIQLASSGSDRTVRLWDMDPESCGSGHVLRTGPRHNRDLSYSPDGSSLAVGATSTSSEGDEDNPPTLWDPTTGRRTEVLEDVPGIVFALDHAADGALIVVADEPRALMAVGTDGSVVEGPVTTSTWFADLAVGPAHRVALHVDEELLLWDRESGEESRHEIGSESAVDSMVWSAGEDVLFCLSSREGILAFDGTRWTSFDLP